MNTLKILPVPHGVHAPPYRKNAIAPAEYSAIYELILYILKSVYKKEIKAGCSPIDQAGT